MPKAECSFCKKEIQVPPGPSFPPYACDSEECRKKRAEFYEKNRQVS